MADVVSTEIRSRMMSGIQGKNTKPEVLVRKLLHALGYRFRLHRKELPGAPDIVLPGRRAAIFVHGCFWHMHPRCKYAKLPSTRPEFWKQKLERNVERDGEAVAKLRAAGWRVLVVWECATRAAFPREKLSDELARWLESSEAFAELGALG